MAEPKKGRGGPRESVLIEKTPRELTALVGPDTKIKVGRKALKLIIAKQHVEDVKDEHGL